MFLLYDAVLLTRRYRRRIVPVSSDGCLWHCSVDRKRKRLFRASRARACKSMLESRPGVSAVEIWHSNHMLNRVGLNLCPAWLQCQSRENYPDVSRLHSSERRGAKQGQMHEPPRPAVAIGRITSAYVPIYLTTCHAPSLLSPFTSPGALSS